MQRQFILVKEETKRNVYLDEGEILHMENGIIDGNKIVAVGKYKDEWWLFYNECMVLAGDQFYEKPGLWVGIVVHYKDPIIDGKTLMYGKWRELEKVNIVCRGTKDGVEVTIL